MNDTDQIHERLNQFYLGLQEDSWIVRLARDPLRPPKDGRVRLNPVLVFTAGIMILAWATFIFFSLGV
jgi:hypothetical protein